MDFVPVITDIEVSCSADASDLILLPVPGSQTITGTATEVRDQFREAES
jgi:hypothetical protein